MVVLKGKLVSVPPGKRHQITVSGKPLLRENGNASVGEFKLPDASEQVFSQLQEWNPEITDLRHSKNIEPVGLCFDIHHDLPGSGKIVFSQACGGQFESPLFEFFMVIRNPVDHKGHSLLPLHQFYPRQGIKSLPDFQSQRL